MFKLDKLRMKKIKKRIKERKEGLGHHATFIYILGRGYILVCLLLYFTTLLHVQYKCTTYSTILFNELLRIISISRILR